MLWNSSSMQPLSHIPLLPSPLPAPDPGSWVSQRRLPRGMILANLSYGYQRQSSSRGFAVSLLLPLGGGGRREKETYCNREFQVPSWNFSVNTQGRAFAGTQLSCLYTDSSPFPFPAFHPPQGISRSFPLGPKTLRFHCTRTHTLPCLSTERGSRHFHAL